jgi:hypothetical protein
MLRIFSRLGFNFDSLRLRGWIFYKIEKYGRMDEANGGGGGAKHRHV